MRAALDLALRRRYKIITFFFISVIKIITFHLLFFASHLYLKQICFPTGPLLIFARARRTDENIYIYRERDAAVSQALQAQALTRSLPLSIYICLEISVNNLS